MELQLYRDRRFDLARCHLLQHLRNGGDGAETVWVKIKCGTSTVAVTCTSERKAGHGLVPDPQMLLARSQHQSLSRL